MRPTKLDDLTAQRIVDATAKGLPRDTCAKLARIHPATLYDWLRRGRAGESPYAELSDRIKEAEAKGEAELVDLIRDVAKKGTWVAAAWLLERRRPGRYALRRAAQEPAVPAAGDRLAAMSDKEFAAERQRVCASLVDSMGTQELETTCQRIKARLEAK